VGKTTLLRTLSRHLDPLKGRVEIEGRSLIALNNMELAKVMAVVLTDKVSPPLFSVFEFVALGRYPHTDFLGRLGAKDRAAVERAISAVHAQDLALRPFADLSDGERQKALVARALAQEPRLLLLDEPTNHLDLKHRMEVMAILRDLCRKEKITVVASLHDVDIAAKVSDQVALVKNGIVAAWGPPEEMLQSRTVADLYDFDSADFDNQLGSIELRSSGVNGRAFVVAGMGSGAVIYRVLSKRGFAITTGVLHTNDLDYFVARSLGTQHITQSPMDPIDPSISAAAEKQLDDCQMVIDSGFAVGGLNQPNIELLRKAVEIGKPVFSLRKDGMDTVFPDGLSSSVTRCDNLAQLMETLDHKFLERNQASPSNNMEKKAS
jgi:iron complex transport system ATP-binding protein